MLIRKAYRFRLKTNPVLEQKLFRHAGCCRWIWNQIWRMNQRRLDAKQPLIWYQEAAYWLTLWKQSEEYGFLRKVHSQPLQQVLKDLDRAYRDAFDKDQPLKRLPRKKRKHQHASFRYPQGVKLDNRRIYLPKIGWVGFFKSREVEGKVKNATVSWRAGHWYVSVQVEQELPESVHPSTLDVGIDLGVANFASLSNGITYDPISPYRKYQNQLARAQRALNRKVKFSENWKRQKRRIQRLHHKIACCRQDFLHKISTTISENQAVVFVEDLKVRNMSRSAAGTLDEPGRNVRAKAGLNRSILDQGWSEFVRQLDYKLQWKGGWLVKVPAHHTSQECAACGHTSPDNRPSQAVFHCRACGHKEHADINAAKNIRARGHRVLACGGNGIARLLKQEPVGNREGVPPVVSPEAAGIPPL
ncbi:transposase [Marinobacter lutaoensis]|uniref:Transposase n=1 Tax=Marinobacter lutaoensis TaxID=135739 RepID=A0A1V2DPG0_9GAMM|nr:RNA-guided endonuclease TnpB family protein [Marinobacter lutaoensis]ONF42515.1 transposase [Marinobacter lutaoensis]